MPPQLATQGLLVAEPAEFVTTTLKAAPLSAALTGTVVYEEAVAPLMAAPFSLH